MPKDSILVVFDLDDTLIDTTGVLVPEALARVAKAIGVEVAQLNPKGKKIDEVLEPLGGVTPELREAAAKEWYAPEVPPLEPLPGALAALHYLVMLEDCVVVLLTRGDPERQENKIDTAGLRPYFREIRIRPIEGAGSKRDDLRDLLERYHPSECFVIGDDECDELLHAKELGCKTLKVPDVPLDRVHEYVDKEERRRQREERTRQEIRRRMEEGDA